MGSLRWPGAMRRVQVYTDGAIRPEQRTSGLAAIVRDEGGAIRCWWSRRAGPMTCNEAEYAAVLFALESLRRLRPAEVAVYCDSRLVVDQMQGRATARAAALRSAHTRLRALVGEFGAVTFHYIPRDRNRLADALANEVVNSVNGWEMDKRMRGRGE